MSCNCNAKYDNKVPCCCSQGSPLVCTTTTCADAQPCDQTIESDCVIYTGPNIACSGVTTGMTVTQVMDIILEGVNLINCSYCWNVINSSGLASTFDYVDVDGNTINSPIAGGATVKVCGRSVDTTNVTATKLGRCSACFPVTTTTSTISPFAARCTAGNGEPSGTGYFRLERTWIESSYTFTLTSMVLDGVEYADGETLLINPPNDLQVGISLIDGLPYIMNINDWLNSITGVAASGFSFYDDMHVIYKPTLASTYTIAITMVSPGSNSIYYYTSQYGFGIGDPDTLVGTYTCESALLPIIPQARVTAIGAAPGAGASSSGRSPVASNNASYMMERTFQEIDDGLTFILSNLVLDGVEYSDGEQLHLYSFQQLKVGFGVDGITPHVMNISDWISSIVPGLGFRFYDEMSTIDIPSTSSTYDVLIRNTNTNFGDNLYNRWFRLSDGTTGWNVAQAFAPPTIPYANHPWDTSSPIVTTTTTYNVTSNLVSVYNNSANYSITYFSPTDPYVGDISIFLPLSPGALDQSTHSAFMSGINVSTNGPGRLRLFVDTFGNGNSVLCRCECFSTPFTNYIFFSMQWGPVSENTAISLFFDDGSTC